jgi:microcystin-dependent protein
MANKKITELPDVGVISIADEIPLARAGKTYKAKIGLSIVPAGCVTAFAGNNIPEGWLKCDGSTIPNAQGTVQGKSANFSTLYSVVGGTLPDLRGYFIRGLDDGRGIDAGRTLKSSQDDALKTHKHPLGFNRRTNEMGGSGLEINASKVRSYDMYTNDYIGANETRPKNVALHYIIKY